MKATYPYTLVVDHVHDADTIMGQLSVDAGLGIRVTFGATGPLWAVRFYGIQAPELEVRDLDTGRMVLYGPGVAARDWLEQYVKPGDALAVASYSWDKYGKRIDGIPYLADGTDLCEALVAAGHAQRL